jgi:outer membrane autotransporter protein
MMFESRNRAARSGLASTPRHGGFLIKSRPGSTGTLGRLRAQLLSGAAGIALPAASMVVALGVGLSTEARAQSSGFNGTQATTYTLTTGANTATFTFGPNTVIGPTAPGTPGVTGDTLTGWNVINQGQISGGGGGGGYGILLTTAGGTSVTNSGSITGGVQVGGNGSVSNLAGGTITGAVSARDVTNAGIINGGVTVSSLAGGSLTNQSGGTITDLVRALRLNGAVTLTNAGTLGGGVYLASDGATVTNQSGGTITNGATGAVAAVIIGGIGYNHPGGGTVTNAGTITGTGSGTDGVALITTGSVINLNGGTITSAAANGVYIAFGGVGSVTNAAGGAITGATNGVSTLDAAATVTVTNAGAIKGTAANGIYLKNSSGVVANQAGGTITGAVSGVRIYNNSFGAPLAATVTNAGTITGTSGPGVSITTAASANMTNLAGGTITGTTGVYIHNIFDTATTITNAGTITGTGGTAIQFFSGQTNTLILQTGSVLNGTAIGSGSPGGNTVILQGSGTANNQFTNFLVLDVQASGVWVLNGAQTGSLAFLSTEIQSGTLVIGDASHPGAQVPNARVVIDHGATLGGQGTVNSVVAAPGATIAPGVVSPFSTFNVTSNVQFDVGSFFNVNVSPTGQTDKLAIGGTATLTGGIVQVLTPAQNFAAQTSATILTAGTRNSTTFAGVTASSIFLSPSLSYPSQQQVVLTLTSKPFATAASTSNQTSVANALNAGAQNALTALLFGQTSIAGAQQIFDALSGEVIASVQNTQAEETQFARNAMLGRMRQADAEGDTAALGFGGPIAFAESLYDNLPAPIASANASANGRNASSSRELTSWLQGFGGFGKTDSNGNAASLSTTYSGFLTGGDIRYGMLRAGLMGGYSHANLNVDARGSSGGIDSAQLGAYGSLSVGGFHLRSGASASFDTVDTSRTVAVPGFVDHTRGHFNGNTAQIFSEVAYSMAINKIAIEPFAGLAYVHVHDASFLESGGLAALSAAASNENIGYSSLGLRAATQWTLANGTIVVPHASAAYQYAFGDVTPTAALAFASTGAAFTVAGVPIAKNSALIEGGIDWRITAQIKLGVGYQGELAKSAQTNTAKGSFTWNF